MAWHECLQRCRTSLSLSCGLRCRGSDISSDSRVSGSEELRTAGALPRQCRGRDGGTSGEIRRAPELRSLPRGYPHRKKNGKHAGVNCEACHGPQAQHADDPTSVKPDQLDTAVLCARCHEANAAKLKNFPQVDTAEHSSGLPCDTCHQPHSPVITAGGAK